MDAEMTKNYDPVVITMLLHTDSACSMTFFKVVENATDLDDGVPALEAYVPNSVIYVILYLLALPPNILLAYLGLKQGLITSRVKYPTLGMTFANLFGLVGFLILNFVYLFAVINDIRMSLFLCSLFRTLFYNSSYVCYFLFPVLAIDQWLMVCHNRRLHINTLFGVISVCFMIPMAVGLYDLFLQDVILYDFMFTYIRMSPYTNVFFFFVLAPSFFIFSFICNLLVLLSIVQRQSKTARAQIGRSLNPRQLQQQKSVVYTYTLQAFVPLVLATPYYIACVFFMFSVEIDIRWFIIGEAIIGAHPLSNALITLFLLRPYRRALRKIYPNHRKRYNSIQGGGATHSV
uniref:G_PROTEIN_RECEP_F1_2 domain-containing protein n=1 Tax=Steinernema glaseri TaxID=37863 RepID=A0A1I8ASW6_9BILA